MKIINPQEEFSFWHRVYDICKYSLIFFFVLSEGMGLYWQLSGDNNITIIKLFNHPRASLVAQPVKNLPAMQETWVQSLGRKDPLEREWLLTSAFLSGEFHGQRGLVGYNPQGCKESDMTE